jgi:transcriptional regulator with XRE-family HTH domain
VPKRLPRLGPVLRTIRLERGREFRDVWAFLNEGRPDEERIGKPTLSKWEHGKNRPPRGILPALAAAYGVPLERILQAMGDPVDSMQSPVTQLVQLAGENGASSAPGKERHVMPDRASLQCAMVIQVDLKFDTEDIEAFRDDLPEVIAKWKRRRPPGR